jgi:hypothetical protein
LRRWSINLILYRFSNLDHLSEASAEIFNLEVSTCDRTLILLRVVIIGIDPLIVIESSHVIVVVILYLMLARGGRSRLLGDGGHRLKV